MLYITDMGSALLTTAPRDQGQEIEMSYTKYTTVKIVSRAIPGGAEYQVQELNGFPLSEWTLIDAARSNADAVEHARTAPAADRGWGGLDRI